MQCAVHTEATATGYCSNCGLTFCAECLTNLESRVLCARCAEEFRSRIESGTRSSSPQTTVSPTKNSYLPPIPVSETNYLFCPPGVSLVLGFVPGVGAICNGDYSKAFIHVLAFGSLVSLAGSNEISGGGTIFVLLSILFYIYMPLEAYHTAKKRILALQGVTIITPLEKMRISDFWIGVVAISFGTIFLVNQFVEGTLRFVLRGWPLALIGIGVYNLIRHMRAQPATGS
jgi:hypothetical protein